MTYLCLGNFPDYTDLVLTTYDKVSQYNSQSEPRQTFLLKRQTLHAIIVHPGGYLSNEVKSRVEPVLKELIQ